MMLVLMLLKLMLIMLMLMMLMLSVSSECDCDPDGSVSPHCSDLGLCRCKAGATGRRCDSCVSGFTWRGGGAGCTGTLAVSCLGVS